MTRTMRAWRLAAPGGALELERIAAPEPRAGTVCVRMAATPLLSYLAQYIAGELPYRYPPSPFTPGTNGVGTIAAVGADVHHLKPGQRVALSPHILAAENVEEPAQALMGLTGVSADFGEMIAAWRDGTLAEEVLLPAAAAVPLDGLDAVPDDRLATLGKFVVPMGGLVRGRLAPGETMIVSGASGYFGSAAVLLGVALGAERIVAAGRNRAALEALARDAGPRVVPVALGGEGEADAAALRAAAGGGAHLALDLVGRADSAAATLAALGALRRGGRLVLMGSMTVPLPLDYARVLLNDWEIIGNFMYRPAAYRRLVALVRGGLLDLDLVRLSRFAMEDLAAAMEQAARMRGLDCTVLTMPSA